MKLESYFSRQSIAEDGETGSSLGHGWELTLFLILLTVVFSLQRLGFGPGPAEGVEQWVNLTNQMFYGKQDFLFSYGPAYWITGGTASPYSASTYWLAVIVSSVLYASFWSSLFTLALRSSTYIFFAIGYILFFYSLIFPSSWYLWPLAVIASLEFAQQERSVLGPKGLLALGLLAGAVFYIRFFYGLMAVAAFGTYFVSLSVAKKKFLYAAPFVVGAALGYVLLGLVIFHQRESLITYIVINNQLNFGNSIDMTLDVATPKNHLLTAMAAMAIVNLYILVRRRALFLTACGMSLLFLKMGFSRIDHCIGYFVVPMAVLALLLLFDGRKLSRWLFVLTLGCLSFMQVAPAFPGGPTRNAFPSPINTGDNYTDRMQKIYSGYKIDASLVERIGTSAIDVYPYSNEYVFANKLHYLHRPVFQNYMTLTPSLDAMNARFFESNDRPKFILWTAGVGCRSETCNVFDDFDGKMSLNEDPLTTSAILLNYHVIAVSHGHGGIPIALLEENATLTAYTPTLIRQESMRFDQWYKVPSTASNVVKLVPRFKLTAKGRLSSTLFHGGIVYISYKLVSGEVLSYRLNILNSASGVWVSPLPSSFDLVGPKIDSILINTKTPDDFAPDFKGEWITVPIGSVRAKEPQYSPFVSLPKDIKTKTEVTCDGAIDVLNGITPIPAEIDGASIIIAQGWLAYSTKEGATFDRIMLTLTDEQGNTSYVGTAPQSRPDVAQAFHQADLASAGYRAIVNLSSLKGRYRLGLAGSRGTELIACRQFATIVTTNEPGR